MRVLQIHNRYREQGGEDRVAHNEARALESAGHELIEHRSENHGGWLQAGVELGLSAWNPFAARHIARLVEEVRPDVTHVHNTWFHLSDSILSAIRGAGSAVVVTLHNYRAVCANARLLRDGAPCELCVTTRSSWPGVRHRCYRNSSVASAAAALSSALHRRRATWQRDADVVAVPSEFVASTLVRGGFRAGDLTIKHHFTADPGPRDAPPSASRSVLFVGRPSPEKGLDVLLSAWSRAAGSELLLDVIGDADTVSAMATRVGARVRVLGQLPGAQVRAKMLEARAVVAPSIGYETFGMVLIEAMAAGAPVIASDIGAFPEVVAELGGDALVPPGDAGALAAAIDRLAGDDADVDRRGAAGRALFEQRYTPAIGLAALEATYQRAIERYRSAR